MVKWSWGMLRNRWIFHMICEARQICQKVGGNTNSRVHAYSTGHARNRIGGNSNRHRPTSNSCILHRTYHGSHAPWVASSASLLLHTGQQSHLPCQALEALVVSLPLTSSAGCKEGHKKARESPAMCCCLSTLWLPGQSARAPGSCEERARLPCIGSRTTGLAHLHSGKWSPVRNLSCDPVPSGHNQGDKPLRDLICGKINPSNLVKIDFSCRMF